MKIKHCEDLKREIADVQEQIELFEDVRKDLSKLLDERKPKEMHGMAIDSSVSGSRNDTSIDRTYYRIVHYSNLIADYNKILGKLETKRDKLIDDISKMTDLQSNIYYLNRVQGKTLAVVAEILDKSEGYILQISAEISQIIKNDKGVF